MRIMIVEDHAEGRYLLESLFKGSGHLVQSASNGEEALQALQAEDFDLVVSDILMPVMDGFQLCRRVRRDERLRRLPFILYTATYTGPQDEEFARKIGADGFIVKPCEPEVLLAAVEQLVLETRSRDGASCVSPAGEDEVYKLYSQRLVRKLEQKMMQLEEEVATRIEAESALRQSESRYRRLFETMRDGLVHTDMQGAIVDANESFMQMLGYGTRELYGIMYLSLVPVEWHRTQLQTIERQLQTRGFSDVFGIELRRADGSLFPAEARTVVVRDEAGAGEGIWSIVRDVSDVRMAEARRKSLEQDLFQAQKMEVVGRLAGGVAHDFNNMLGVILGNSDMALHDMSDDNPLRTYLEEIQEAASRSADLTSQLLAFARKQTIAPRVLDLNEAITSVLKMLKRLIGEDVDLAWVPAAEVWPVRMDPTQIDQVLANLSINARDAIDGVGRITIETANVTMDQAYCAENPGTTPGEYVMLALCDNGCGMDEDTLEHIFEPFFTTKEVHQGTGLGLPMVYGIVKQNNGHIDVRSEPGKGTIIRIHLPRYEGAVTKTPAAVAPEIQRSRGETILLVEDEGAIMTLATRMLETMGYRVLAADNPHQALHLVTKDQGQVHLLITDVVMPGMNGGELADQLRVLCPEVKVLFMSGYTADVLAHRSILDEDLNFIQKPFSSRDLAQKVRSALDRG
jgi:two-component system, cell cycle sensor histidine kinase and response regulator CckA